MLFFPSVYHQDLQIANREAFWQSRASLCLVFNQRPHPCPGEPQLPEGCRLLRLNSRKHGSALNLWLSHEAALQPRRGEASLRPPSEALEISRTQGGLNSGNFIRPAQTKETFLSSFLTNRTSCPSVHPSSPRAALLPHPLWVLPRPPLPAPLPLPAGWTKGKSHKPSSEERTGLHPAFSAESERSRLETGQKTACFCSLPKPKERIGLAAV